MEINEKRGEIIFSTGKIILANSCIVGISPNLELSEGYDGPIYSDELNTKEKIELTNAMIDRWQKFKEMIIENEVIVTKVI